MFTPHGNSVPHLLRCAQFTLSHLREFLMKKILAMGLTVLSMNAFSQSYLVLNNGVALTLDKAAFAYDFGHFVAPYKVNFNGGVFLAEDEKLITIDESGFLYRKDERFKKIKAKGNNYFISDGGNLYTIDSKGFFYKYDKDKDASIKKAKNFGGNFFTVNTDEKKKIVDLFTVNTMGNYFKMAVQGLNAAEISSFGGNYFMTSKGVVYTISKDGFVYPKLEVKTGALKKAGGNFFIDSANVLYTVSEDGFLFVPTIPANLKIESVTKLGANYLVNQEGKLFAIDNKGQVFEREMKAHDLRNTKILSM
jgi:hypothetical protein